MLKHLPLAKRIASYLGRYKPAWLKDEIQANAFNALVRCFFKLPTDVKEPGKYLSTCIQRRLWRENRKKLKTVPYFKDFPGTDYRSVNEILEHLASICDEREQLVLKYRIRGFSDKEIASILDLHRDTVHTIRKGIQRKWDANDFPARKKSTRRGSAGDTTTNT